MILGLEPPTEGEIRLSGRGGADRRRAGRVEFMRHVQPVFQNPFETFNPLKQVDRYLRASARVLLGARGREGAMDEALQKVGLSLAEVRGRNVHELSGGQLQRVAVARALIPHPTALIADEPVSMVDASLRMSIVNLLRDLRDSFGVTVIYITHDLAAAYYISHRIVIHAEGPHRGDGPRPGDPRGAGAPVRPAAEELGALHRRRRARQGAAPRPQPRPGRRGAVGERDAGGGIGRAEGTRYEVREEMTVPGGELVVAG